MIDTHTHLYMTEDFPDTDAGGGAGAVERAIDAGVSRMIFPGVSLASVEQMLSLHHLYPEATSVAAGLHPTEAGPDWRHEVGDIFGMMSDDRIVAVGEVGIDLYREDTWRTRQMDCFGAQVQIALERRLPVIIHCRHGLDETLEVLAHFSEDTPPLIFHSFTSTPDDVRRILEAHPAAMFGFNGVATFKNAPDVRASIREAGKDRIVLETDAPYLAPVPFRGRRNESSYLPKVCDTVAAELQISSAEAEAVTDANARRIFAL